MERLNITVPVLIDSPARRRNLDALLRYLIERKLIDSVTVIEQHSGSPACQDVQCRYLSVCHDDGLIHRIGMLNQAFRTFPATVLFLWDVDAVFEPYAVDLAINQVFYRKFDMLLPFNGYVMDAKPDEYTGGCLFRFLKARAKPSMLDSVGFGAVMNREAWLEAGMENENMVSYGPDDWERWHRWLNLGLKVQKMKLPDAIAIHMSHPNSIYSRQANSMSAHNEAEFEKVKRLSRKALQDYIKTWPWRREMCNERLSNEPGKRKETG